MAILDWLRDNLLGNVTVVTTIILFFAYYKLNKRQKKAEVGQAEGGALTTMQAAYDDFTKDYREKYVEVSEELKEVKNENKGMKREIGELKRVSSGLTREVAGMKRSMREVEDIACIKMECDHRQPGLGTYKHQENDNINKRD